MDERQRRLARNDRAAAPSPAADADALLQRARQALAQGRPREAFAHAQQALANAPGNVSALHLMGRSCLAVGQAPLGLGMLQAAAKAQPGNLVYRIDLGRALAADGKLAEAADLLASAASATTDADVSRDLGAVLHRLGRAEEAEAAYQRAAELAPLRADLHEALARLRYARNALDLARQSFGQALALDPKLADRLAIGHARAGCPVPSGTGEADPTRRPPPRPVPAWQALADDTREAPAAQDRPLADPTALQAACEARSLIVIDDLVADPLAYRERALRLPYPHAAGPAGINYPGRQTAAQPCGAIMQRIADALGRDIKWDSPDHGAFRLSPADASARNDIHVDSASRDEIYAGVLYLSLPEHCRGGTVFWRHRATGWERRPRPDQLAAAGYASFGQFERRWMPVDRLQPFGDLERRREVDWERVLTVPMRFNRLVVYRSDFFHSIDRLFGDRPENSRFVQLFFFEAVATR